jgi:acyl-[acyl-carrier-protein] desaturase
VHVTPLLAELAPRVEELYERHLSTSREWHPHSLVPYSRGRDFEPDYQWDPSDTNVPADIRSALFVNLLTEDNLPFYFRDIERMFSRVEVYGEWVRRWTAEEGRHGVVIRDYLTVTRALDPVELERARMAQVQGGQVPEPPDEVEGMVYVAVQELATRISHLNTGKALRPHDEVGYEILKRVAADENFHYMFYVDLASAALELDPSRVVRAIENQIVGFAMPGVGIPGFKDHARRIADAGIYDVKIHHDNILQSVVMQKWGLAELEGLDADADAARERIIAAFDKIRRVGDRMAERRDSRLEQAELVVSGG